MKRSVDSRSETPFNTPDERYRTLVQSIDQGFFVGEMIFDEQGQPVDYRFIETNPAFERHTGLVDAVGRRALEIVPGLEHRWIEIYGRVAARGKPERFVEESSAMGRWFEVDAFPVGRPEQHRVGALFTEISERKHAEDALRESAEQLRLAKAAAGIGIHDFNPSTGTISWDGRTREIWGIGEDEPITYELWLEGIHPEDRESAEAAVASALDPDGDGLYLAEYRVTNRRDGVTRWIHVTGHTTFSGGVPVRLVGTVHDISQRKNTEDALRESDRRKDEFLAALSHELRTPLAAVHGAVGVMKELDDMPESGARMTSIIDRQIGHLVRLIDDLLDINRITKGKMHLEPRPVDLCTIIREVTGDSRASCEKEGIELTVTVPEEPVLVDVDPVRFAQVVGNLLSNACRFTPSGGKVGVTVERRAGEAEVRVADTGLGMTREELRRVFDMFVQAERAKQQGTKGLGIGLSLAKSITHLHGGSIEAYSAGLGEGSEFRVRLRTVDGLAEASQSRAPER